MPGLELPLTGEQITLELLRRQPHDTPYALEERARRFADVFAALPEIAEELITAYKDIAMAYGRNPGHIALMMVGGRVKGNPLRPDSDIDLVFMLENPQGAVEWTPKTLEEVNEWVNGSSLVSILIQRMDDICRKRGVSNFFDILGYREPMPQYLQVTERQIPLAYSN